MNYPSYITHGNFGSTGTWWKSNGYSNYGPKMATEPQESMH